MSEWMCSCVILNYNDAETTIKLVKQINQYSCLRWIVVVDNCSTDDSMGALDVIRDNDKVIIIQTQKNGGYGYGNNFGVNFACNTLHEEVVLIVNPDVEFTEECLIQCIQALKRSSDRAVVSPVQLDSHGIRVRQYGWNLESGLRTLLPSEYIMRHTLFPLPCAKVDLTAEEAQVDCVPGSFLLVNAKKFLQVGGYNEDIFLYYEEMTLGSRLRKAGWKTILLPQQTYLHMHSVSVNKSIPKWVSQRRIQNESLLTYLRDECGYGSVRYWFAKWFLKVCLSEEKVLGFIKLRMGSSG